MPSTSYTPVREMGREGHQQQYFEHRLRYLPIALDNARRKVAALENEARRYGMHELVEARDA